MANSKLEDKTFVIPDHVIRTVKPGTMRSDFVIRRKDGLSYYNIKRLKHFYDNLSEKDPKTYNALGDELKKWVEKILNTYRDSMHKGKKIKSDIGMLNVFKKAHNKDKSRGKLGIRIPKPNMNARQIFTGKGLYENIMEKVLNETKENDIKSFKRWEKKLNIPHDENLQESWLKTKYKLKGVNKNILSYESKDKLLTIIETTNNDKTKNVEYDIFSFEDDDNKILSILDESLIEKYSTIINSPLYDNVEDIISDIMFYENKSKKYKK